MCLAKEVNILSLAHFKTFSTSTPVGRYSCRSECGIFLGGGAPLRNDVTDRYAVLSQEGGGGGCALLAPSPRSAPELRLWTRSISTTLFPPRIFSVVCIFLSETFVLNRLFLAHIHRTVPLVIWHLTLLANTWDAWAASVGFFNGSVWQSINFLICSRILSACEMQSKQTAEPQSRTYWKPLCCPRKRSIKDNITK